MRPAGSVAAPRLGYADVRVVPFLAVGASLQAVRATTVITLALFLQDTFVLTAEQAAQRAGMGFVALAASGLFSQLVLVQRLRPTARTMIQTGVPLMVLAFALLVVGGSFVLHLVALGSLGLGLGLAPPGSAAGASLAVSAEEQGAVAGLLGGLAVLGNVFGPMLGTTLYTLSPRAPYALNGALHDRRPDLRAAESAHPGDARLSSARQQEAQAAHPAALLLAAETQLAPGVRQAVGHHLRGGQPARQDVGEPAS